jgi:hypothetical protein
MATRAMRVSTPQVSALSLIGRARCGAWPPDRFCSEQVTLLQSHRPGSVVIAE